MYRGLLLSVSLIFSAQSVFAGFDRCIQDLRSASREMRNSASSLDSAIDIKGFRYFSKLMKDGDKRHISNAERFLSRRGTSLEKKGYDIYSSITESLPQTTSAVNKCKRQSSCSGLNRSKKYQDDLAVKCEQLNAINRGFRRFTSEKNRQSLVDAANLIVKMRGTNRNSVIIARSQKSHRNGVVDSTVAQGGEVTTSPAQNGELIDNLPSLQPSPQATTGTADLNDDNFFNDDPSTTAPATSDSLAQNPPAPPLKRAPKRKAKKKSRNRHAGSFEAVESCQQKNRRNFRKFKYCGCRIHSSKRTRYSCQRGVARQSKSELCSSSNIIKRTFRRQCRKTNFSNSFWGSL